MQTREGNLSGPNKPKVQMAKTLVKTRVFINSNGDQIDPRTKQILKRNVEEK